MERSTKKTYRRPQLRQCPGVKQGTQAISTAGTVTDGGGSPWIYDISIP